jgi:MFS family permease
MPAAPDLPLSLLERRRARRLAYWNGAIWALGNGLTSSMLILYLAMEFKVPGMGLAISLILAAPQLAGLLRLGAPPVIGRLVERKRFCLAAYLLSALVLAGLPLAAAPGRLPSPAFSLAVLVVLWCVYQVLEYLGTVALWSWLADLVPLRIRGRFLGRRERWMAAGQAVGLLASGLFVWQCPRIWPTLPHWVSYAIPGCMGAWFMIAALVPLGRMPRATFSRAARSGASLAALLAPLADRRFWPLLLFGCWLSFFNGIIELPQSIFPNMVLGVGVSVMLWLKTGLRVGQMAVGPWTGRLIDRLGHRAVMIGSLLLVAQGPLFYFLASRGPWWWMVGAWVMWIAWVGLNIGQPGLMLKLAPRQTNTPYIALWFTVTGLCYAASTILGGLLFDRYRDFTFTWAGRFTLDYYQMAFLLGWLLRSAGVLVLLRVVEGERRKDEG